MYDSAESIQKAMAETLQSEWAALGVKLNIVGVELTVQIERFKANDFELNFFSNYGAPYDPHTFVNVVGSEGFGFNEAISSYPNRDELLKQIADVPEQQVKKNVKNFTQPFWNHCKTKERLCPFLILRK